MAPREGPVTNGPGPAAATQRADRTGLWAELWAEVDRLLDQAPGTFGYSFLDLGEGRRQARNGDEPFYAASVIKVPLMCEVFRQEHAGRIDFSQRAVISRADQVGGSGVLQVLTPGTELTWWDIVTLMIVVSDNTATNLLIDRCGLDSVNQFMDELGLPGIRLHHKLMVVEVGRRRHNTVTPNDTTELMARIARRRLISERACGAMVDILKRQQYHDHLTKYLPLDAEVHAGSLPPVAAAHKNGWVNGSRLDTGIFYLAGAGRRNRDYVLSVFSKEVADNLAADEAIARVGKLVYERIAAEADT